MSLKITLLNRLMQVSNDVFRDTMVILECRSYLHRSEIPEDSDRFDKAVALIQLSEKMRGLGMIAEAIERAEEIERGKQKKYPAL